MADTNEFLLNSPFINAVFYKTGANAGKLADGATIGFYSAADHSSKLDIFKDSKGLVPWDQNPIILPQGWAPPIYMQNLLYYIEIKDKYGNLIESIDDYTPNSVSGGGGDPAKQDANILSNGQFSYPINFSLEGDGKIGAKNVSVAYGWSFVQDVLTTTTNIATFQSVATSSLPANPTNMLVIESQNPSATESRKDISQIIGTVNSYENDFLTFSLNAIDLASTAGSIEIILHKNYGNGGSEEEFISLTTINLTPSNSNYVYQAQLPSNASKTIGDGNYLEILYRLPLKTTCKIGVTNILILLGKVASPEMPEVGFSQYMSQIVGEMFQSTIKYNGGEGSNYNEVSYANGQLLLENYYPEIKLFPIGEAPASWVRCDGSEHSPKDEVVAGYLTYDRMHSAIGQKFGGGGDLIVTSSGDVVTFASGAPAREKSAYSAGTLGSKIKITNVKKGYQYDCSIVVSGNTLIFTTITDFAPSLDTNPGATPTILGLGDNGAFPSPALTTSDSAPGSPTTKAVFNLNFNTSTISYYESTYGALGSIANVCGYNTPTSNTAFNSQGWSTPSAVIINISVDGQGLQEKGKESTAVVPFSSSKTLAQNLQIYANLFNNSFEWTVEFEDAPSAGQYFEPSSDSQNLYVWYKVDGAGTDPAVPGKDAGVEVDITSADSPTAVSEKTAAAVNSYKFKLPLTGTHTPTLPATATSLVDYYIKG